MNKPSNHGLRTTGTHTGNFGRSKVKGKPGELDLSKKILAKENLRIPNRQDALARLSDAYRLCTEPKLKVFLAEELSKAKAQAQLYATTVIPGGTPVTPTDKELDPKGRFRDFGINYDVGSYDSTYNFIHRVS